MDEKTTDMTTQKYILRAVKYLIRLTVMLAALFALMVFTGMSRVPADRFIDEMLLTPRGILMLAVLVGVSAFYPSFGYISRTIAGDPVRHREAILHALMQGGYSLVTEENNRMVFRASSPARRIMLLGEDPVTVTAGEGQIVVSGHRKAVVMGEFRLRGYMQEE